MPESKASGTAYTMTRTQREDGDGSPGSDAFGMIGMLLTVVTMFTRSKLMAWVSLVLVLSSIFNSRSSQMDCSRIMTALMFVVMSLVTVYLTPESAPGPVEQFTKYFASFTGATSN
ncbi:hypothetical protein FNF27_05889 [Cafeteria roenbergensis]|uniref:Protein Asterix n=1 Tax=Cafeteria roenbergensis TaxID=33653 RepID=A0A5A8CMX0_CAFRO|nr:hypothetical protein FNF29_02572 [Cafeteria roenbergensis]KAA0159544.1 hypothetical protein FNF31_04783 [Cafeteria roenbergensis]KAA0159749.1 hypothetical protein FNF28_05712 [Cafeteria roenbergensis]KAA0172665.1 hypothetical protein FNF27_05889 [Cafeteria roenbergensis]|eukprot:KAA0154352.1 hypothetical protein FNF29_02572 [Cafeteria roenbergensis]